MMSLMSSSHPRWNTKMSFCFMSAHASSTASQAIYVSSSKKKELRKKDVWQHLSNISHISKSKRFQIFQIFESVEMPPPKLVSLEFKQRRLRQPTATTVDPTLTLHTLSCLCGSTTRRQESWQTCHDCGKLKVLKSLRSLLSVRLCVHAKVSECCQPPAAKVYNS